MEIDGKKKKRNLIDYLCIKKWVSISSSSTSSSPEALSNADKKMAAPRKPGGWKTMPFVLGNETFERLSSSGLMANFTVFLLTVYHLDQVSASNLMNIWSSLSNFAPLLGAFISDAYVGKFWTIALSSVAQILGMLMLTIIVSLPHLHPSPCSTAPAVGQQCKAPTRSQMGFLFIGLGLLSIGTGGISPCSIPFGVDQFDASTEEGRKGINSFFNWYYTSFTAVLIIALTAVVYIQDSVSWVLGFGIPTALMFCGIVMFFIGMPLYVYVKPEGSIFSSIARVGVAAYRKRHKVHLTHNDDQFGANGIVYYDPPLLPGSVVTKLPLTHKYRFLNKAAVVTDGDINSDNGKCTNPWRLTSIQQMEEVKCILKVIPIWPAGIICSLAIMQQGTFTVSQALHMDRHLGPHFQIPAGSIFVVSLVSIALWVPVYDRVLIPYLRKRTGNEGGITMLQRIGIGLGLSSIAMVVSGFVETKRRATAISGGPPISIVWLFPQLIVMGLAEAFTFIAQIEFYNREFPENLMSVGNSLTSVTWGIGAYLSSMLVNLVHKTTAVGGRPDWLTEDINAGRVDYYYFVIAALGGVSLVHFVYISRRYVYKSKVHIDDGAKV
ncbi:unnamed protein product [Cuscuta epithymum]|uniref:Uncharacterized protein n=1 Tax=Cuscuta epithymum TaxID=186058 RepID=A0AAV0D5C6_9ASTE|nr:unnamed protein product [Cuscuta epithymum]